MLVGSTQPSSRTHSLSSSSVLSFDACYETIDMNRLYEALLKFTILEYSNEARFWKQEVEEKESRLDFGGGSAGGGSGGANSVSRHHSLKSMTDGQDVKLPGYLLSSLETRLNLIAMKKRGSKLDDKTRRSLLRFYSELLDPRMKSELTINNTPEYWVMKFVSCANKELVKLGGVPSEKISMLVFQQAEAFVQILISLVQKDKNHDSIVARLQAHKESLKPNNKSRPLSSGSSVADSAGGTINYIQPSYRYTDMDQGVLGLLMEIFNVDLVKIQQDIFKFKDLCQAKTFHKDVKQLMFYLDKDLGQFSPESFTNPNAYKEWKTREKDSYEHLMAKYSIPPTLKLLPIPQLPSGEDFYVLPTSSLTKPYYVVLAKLCLIHDMNLNLDKLQNASAPFLSNQSINLLQVASKYWRIDFPTKAVAFYTAAHMARITSDSMYDYSDREIVPVDVERTITVLNTCKRIVEDQGKLDWSAKLDWSSKDQENWIKALTQSYNQTFFALKDCLQSVLSKAAKPNFGQYLSLLGEYIESDPLFGAINDSGLPKKWEKKLSKTLLRTSEARYAELLSALPRDDTLSILHILEICDSIVDDIKRLQKRYKNPLLGYLNILRTVAAVLTGMFAADARNILKHIDAYAKSKQMVLPYGDALEAYKSLFEIREIYRQVSLSNSEFKFDLEAFFFPFLKGWIDESGDKIQEIIREAVGKDDFEPLDLENDQKKHTSSVMDIFALVKHYVKILNDLHWGNEYQLASVYTELLKSISDGVISFANIMADIVFKDLAEDEQMNQDNTSANQKADKRKSGNWFDEVKNVVSNLQNGGSKIELEKPYNFKPRLCLALNNLASMMHHLTKLEDMLDPEEISACVASYDPTIQKNYTSHVFSLRLVRAENLRSTSSSSSLHPYVTMIDTKARKTLGKTRAINNNSNPDWDEEFEITISANTIYTISVTVWDERFGTHSICGRALLVLDPNRFEHDGIPQEVYLDLDSQGRVLVEVAVERERMDAIFVMGRAHRCLQRTQERCIKLVVEKFSNYIHYCFSRSSLKAICGSSGNLKPTDQQLDEVMMPLYNYLNMNLEVLAGYLTNELLMKVMLAAWTVVVSTADELLLPKLASAKTFHLANIGNKIKSNQSSGQAGWQLAVSSAVANVTNSIGISGFGKQLTHNEMETVFSWLRFLCFDFFHNNGNGPPIKDLKNQQYQALLLVPVYYDRDVAFLIQEVDRLSPAFVMTLRDRNNFVQGNPDMKNGKTQKFGAHRAGSIIRNKTIVANATAKSRAMAAEEVQKARSDPIATQTLTEDIILRLLIIKGEHTFVARRLEQREKLARSIATERLAKAAAEGRFAGT